MSPQLPRERPATGIGGRRRRIGESSSEPALAAPEAPKPAAATATTPKPAAKAAKAAAPDKPETPATPGRSQPAAGRPRGSSRLALDLPAQLADDFRARAKKHRFTQNVALAGAMRLLEDLDDRAYERLLTEVREDGR